MLYDTVQSELEEKIRRLEEDRHSIDITSGQGRGVMVSIQPQSSRVNAVRVNTVSQPEGAGEEPSKE